MSDKTDEMIAEEKKSASCHMKSKVGFFFLLFAFILVICGFGYGYFQLAKVNVALAQKISVLENRAGEGRDEIKTLQNSLIELQQAGQKTQAASEKQEQMMADWQAVQKGDLSKWNVAEAHYLVKLANDYMQYTHNTVLVLTLLQRAEQVLQNLQDPTIVEIRKSLASDIANLQALPKVDTTSIYLQLTTINDQLDQLPLPASPLKSDSNQETIAEETALPWWKKGLNRSLQALKQIVIVRYDGSKTLPLVLPEEKIFLYQNLHAQVENIMWAVLNRDASVYGASLTRAITWIQRYFVQDAQITKTVLQNLQALQKIEIQPSAINFSATIQLFDTYFSRPGQTEAQ